MPKRLTEDQKARRKQIEDCGCAVYDALDQGEDDQSLMWGGQHLSLTPELLLSVLSDPAKAQALARALAGVLGPK